MNTLKIEVTEAMADAFETTAESLGAEFEGTGLTPAVVIAALTAAFQHPEFVAQFKAAIPENAKHAGDDAYIIESGALTLTVNTAFATGYNCANDIARASLGRLLGEG